MSDRWFTHAEFAEEYREMLGIVDTASQQGALEHAGTTEGAAECQRLLNKISNSSVRNGMPTDDDEEPDDVTAMLTTVCATMRSNAAHTGVAKRVSV